MTYATLSIQEYPATVTPVEFETAATKSTQLFNWDHRSRDCFPHELSAWAKSRDIPAHFVDNDWIRVPVSPAQLSAFAKEVLGIDRADAIQRLAAEAEGLVVIEAEAF
jgi:hypothetical protein